MINQRDSVGVGIGGGVGARGMKLYGDAHWVLERGYRSVVIHIGRVEGEEEVSEPVVYEFFQVEDELTDCSRNFSRIIPPENMNDGALINGVIRIDHLRTREAKEGIDEDENDTDGVIMNGASPLKIMIHGEGKGGSDVSFPEGRERSVVGLMY